MIETISENIYVFRFKQFGSTVYFLKDKLILIDTSAKANKDELIKYLSELHTLPEQIKIIINTHEHYDHVSNNSEFQNAKIYFPKTAKHSFEIFQDFTRARFGKKELDIFDVDEYMSEGDLVEELKVIETPGHSIGSICLFDAKTCFLYSGDTIFSDGVFGRYDLPTSSKEQLIESIKKLEKISITKILPGHGKISDKPKQDIEKCLNVLNS